MKESPYIYDVTFDTSGAVTQGDDGNVIITGFDASSDSIVLRGGYGSSQSTAAYADGGTSNVDIASNISGDTVITLGNTNDKTGTITLKGVSDSSTVSLKSINQPADSGSPTVDLSSGTVTAAAAGEIFEYSVNFLNGVPVFSTCSCSAIIFFVPRLTPSQNIFGCRAEEKTPVLKIEALK